ncbi:unnamed protein product [Vicia faba]|uniref:Uncharacterized protein n=1 Tax=Vicia faba TaxID=3906 RepID=A0AAV1B3T2_VICFA|nr:unnamed protein product [Vicia faba]
MLSGELPSKIICNFPQLQYLYLSYNNFVSHDGNTNLEPFFASLMNSSNFQELELARNGLGGKLPHIIGNLPSGMQHLHLQENLIHGAIPPQISSLVNLTLLKLYSNQINGTIPRSLCNIDTNCSWPEKWSVVDRRRSSGLGFFREENLTENRKVI